MITHLIQKHLVTSHQLDTLGYRDILEALEISPIPQALTIIIEQQPIQPLEGLKTIQGFECVDCGDVFASKYRGQRHEKEAHDISGKDNQSAKLRDCFVQCLQVNGRFFKVEEHQPGNR